ncbi:hypothetical protein ACWD25_52000 [Streptomyces sp. NPDC002920]
MTDYVSQQDLGKARTQITEEIKTAIQGNGPAVTTQIDGAIKKYDAEQQVTKPLLERMKGLLQQAPAEFNGIKSELTLIKSEFVPVNFSLPSIFSFEELIKKQLNLDYNQYGLLTRQTGSGGGGGGAAPGPRGPRGEQGPRGAAGAQGPQGREGRRGPRGERGEQGRQGRRGEQGRQGRQGTRGAAGPPPSTESLRNATRDARSAEDALRGVVREAERLSSRLDDD